MQPQRPVYWYSGQFLEPQHFQQADAHHASERCALFGGVRPFFWGVGGVQLDETGLAAGNITIHAARLRFSDGTEAVLSPVSENSNAVLPARTFLDAWSDRHSPLTVYVGLTKMNPSGNVAGLASFSSHEGHVGSDPVKNLPEAPGRYLAPDIDDMLPDRCALPHSAESRSEAPVRTLYLYPRLFWEEETKNRPNWLFLPLLRLVDDGTGPRLDPEYAPPSLTIGDSPVLERLVRGLEARLMGIMVRVPPPTSPVSFDAPINVGSLLRMNASRTLSELRHVLAWASPWDVFGILRHGFAALASCTGVALIDALPTYCHDDPAESFRALERLLRKILYGVLPETMAVVRFQAREGLLCADLPSQSANENPVIVLRSVEPAAKLIQEGRLIADTAEALPDSLAHAVAGLALTEIPAPPGLPRQEHIRYIQPDILSERWQAVLRTGTLALALFPAANETDSGTEQAPPPDALAKRLHLLFLRS